LGEGGVLAGRDGKTQPSDFQNNRKLLQKGGMAHHLLSRLCGLTTAKLLRSAMQNEKLAFFFCIALVFSVTLEKGTQNI